MCYCQQLMAGRIGLEVGAMMCVVVVRGHDVLLRMTMMMAVVVVVVVVVSARDAMMMEKLRAEAVDVAAGRCCCQAH